jgi:hypothetical protein
MITTRDLATAAGPIYFVPQAAVPRERRPEEFRAAKIARHRKRIREAIQVMLANAGLWTAAELWQLDWEIDGCLRRSEKRIENSGCVADAPVLKSPQ